MTNHSPHWLSLEGRVCAVTGAASDSSTFCVAVITGPSTCGEKLKPCAAPAGITMKQGASARMRALLTVTSAKPALRYSSCTKASCRCTWISH